MFEKIKKWWNKEIVKNPEKIILYGIFDQDKLKFICENVDREINDGHFNFNFNYLSDLKWYDKFKAFNYLNSIYICHGLINEKIYSDFIYTPGVWDDALKVSLDNVYQKALEIRSKKNTRELERKQLIENLFKKDV